ncbi:MAG TPA: class I SAM-dependent methyltransferase [Polyangiaceae bacterium]|jgi:SAM-dependent methyltransferase
MVRWPRLIRTVKRASNWVDLQWSLLVEGLEAVAPMAHGRMLDVGCGDKPYEAFFRPYVTDYVGVEHEATFEQTTASTRSVADVLYDGHTLPFEDGSFDTVMSIQVLEHTPTPQRLVDEMGRVLADGGTLILTAPFSFRLHEEPHDYFRYSPHGLRVLVEHAGLDVLEVRSQGGLFTVLAHKVNVFLAFRAGRLERVAQGIGKHGHERPSATRPRYWALPAIMPAIVALSAGSRVLDRVLPERTESLGFLVLARKRPRRT